MDNSALPTDAPLKLKPKTILYGPKNSGQYLVAQALMALNRGFDPVYLSDPIDMVIKDLFFDGPFVDKDEPLDYNSQLPGLKSRIGDFVGDLDDFFRRKFGDAIWAKIRIDQLLREPFVSDELLFLDVQNMSEVSHIVQWAGASNCLIISFTMRAPDISGVQHVALPIPDPVEAVAYLRNELGSLLDA